MWHPDDEAEAASDLTAFLEWLRATHGQPDLTPARLRLWADTDNHGFAEALAAFLAPAGAASRAATEAAIASQLARIRRPA